MKIVLILPCYNESENLFKIKKELSELEYLIKNVNFQLIIVNNGSTDNSEDILKSEAFLNSSIRSINVKHNIGYGHGIKEGIRNTKADIYAWAHGDLQTPLRDIINCLFLSIEKKYYIVAGKRLTSGLQKVQSKIFDSITSLCMGFKAYDLNAQPKIFPMEYRNIFLSENSPDDFAMDMYYFKVFNYLNKDILRKDVSFEDRSSGEAKGGGQGSLVSRFILLIKMSKSALKIRKMKFGNYKT